MAARYGLWDVESGNNLGFYPTQDAALAVVRRELRAYGKASVVTLALDRADHQGGSGLVAEGTGLIVLAESAVAPVSLKQETVDTGMPAGKGAGRVRFTPRSRERSFPRPGKAAWKIRNSRSGKYARRANQKGPGDPKKSPEK